MNITMHGMEENMPDDINTWPVGLSSSLLPVLLALLLIAILSVRLIQKWQLGQYGKFRESFSKLKNIQQDLVSLSAISKHNNFVEKLSGYGSASKQENEPFKNCYEQFLFTQISVFFQVLSLMHNSMNLKIFVFQPEQFTNKNIGELIELVPSYLHKISIQIQLNWDTMSKTITKRFQTLKLLNKRLCQLQKIVNSIKKQRISEVEQCENQIFDGQNFTFLDELKANLCQQTSFEQREIRASIQRLKRIRRQLKGQDKQPEKEKSPQSEIKILLINDATDQQDKKHQRIITNIEKQVLQDKEAFKKKLDNLLVFGMHQRRQKLAEIQQETEQTQQLLKAEVEHSKQNSKYELKDNEKQETSKQKQRYEQM